MLSLRTLPLLFALFLFIYSAAPAAESKIDWKADWDKTVQAAK
jgi:hypothetical protein